MPAGNFTFASKACVLGLLPSPVQGPRLPGVSCSSQYGCSPELGLLIVSLLGLAMSDIQHSVHLSGYFHEFNNAEGLQARYHGLDHSTQVFVDGQLPSLEQDLWDGCT